jgi:hypothetical protein
VRTRAWPFCRLTKRILEQAEESHSESIAIPKTPVENSGGYPCLT